MSVILITGANQGIGYFLAEKLLLDNHHVMIIDKDIEQSLPLQHQFPDRLLIWQADVRYKDAILPAVQQAYKTFHKIDIAIHNACKCSFKSMEESSFEEYKDIFNVNYYGALNLCKAVIPYMKKQHSGKIIFTSSLVGTTGFFNISPYASTKGALESLAKCLNLEYKIRGISFHIIHPPLTKTESASSLQVPDQFKIDAKKVGYGLAKNIFKKHFIICHNVFTKLQIKLSYLMPLKMGNMLTEAIKRYIKSLSESDSCQ
ncbi:MAG: SDR family oxidoreductase [Clostridiaceae bacterium]|jgi:NAD(P)-dependent dehydrogenase (short-subunit alcohol dehydrogenase family)|nr:SDR family oxidoreductase [Clostridiaceae bacterium]